MPKIFSTLEEYNRTCWASISEIASHFAYRLGHDKIQTPTKYHIIHKYNVQDAHSLVFREDSSSLASIDTEKIPIYE